MLFKRNSAVRGGRGGWEPIPNGMWEFFIEYKPLLRHLICTIFHYYLSWYPQWFIVSVLEIAIASLSFVSLFRGVKILKPWSWRCILHIDTHSTHLFLHEKCIDKICTTNIRPSVEDDWIISAWYASQTEE